MQRDVPGLDQTADPARDVSTVGSLERVDLKVLFVHGVGTQAGGSHLISCVEPIVDFLERKRPATGTSAPTGDRSRSNPDVDSELNVLSARLTPAAALGDGPAHIVVRTDTGRRWLMAESHWAAAFPEPTYRELVYWGAAVVPAAACAHGIGSLSETWSHFKQTRQAVGTGAGSARRAETCWAAASVASSVLQLLLVMLLAPVLVLVVVILLIIGLIPLTGVRAWVLRVQRMLAGSLGDSMVFVRHPVRRAAILTKVQDDLRWLRATAGSAPVVVVAHSQGAAVAHRLLMTDDDPTRLLVTYGSGLGKLLGLEKSFISNKRALTSPWLATIGAIGLVWLTPNLVASVLDVPLQWLAVLGAYAAAALCAAALRAVSRRREHSSFAVKVLIALLALCGGVPILFVPDWGIFIGLWVTLFLLGGLEVAARLTKGEASDKLMPPRVEQWLDCAASADPVTSGPVTPAPENYQYRRLTLTGSVVRDHTSYWSNRSSFVGILVAQLFALDGSHPPADIRATPTVSAETGHAWRIRARTALRWGLLAAVVTAVVARADWGLTSAVPWVLDVAPGIERLPSSGPWRVYAALAILTGVVLLASAVVYQIVLLPWRAWQSLSRESVTVTSKAAGDESSVSTGKRYRWLAGVAAGLYGAAAVVAVETALSIAWFEAAQAGENLRILTVLKAIPLLLVIWLFLLWFGIQLLSQALTSMNMIKTVWWPRFPVRTAAEILTVGVGTALLVGLPMLSRDRSVGGPAAGLPFDYDPPAVIVMTLCVVIPVVLATIRRRRRASGAARVLDRVEAAPPSADDDVRIEPTQSQTPEAGTTIATPRKTTQDSSESAPRVVRASPVPAAD